MEIITTRRVLKLTVEDYRKELSQWFVSSEIDDEIGTLEDTKNVESIYEKIDLDENGKDAENELSYLGVKHKDSSTYMVTCIEQGTNLDWAWYKFDREEDMVNFLLTH